MISTVHFILFLFYFAFTLVVFALFCLFCFAVFTFLVFCRKDLCEAKHEMQNVFKFSDADVPPSRDIWWPRAVLHKVILTC